MLRVFSGGIIWRTGGVYERVSSNKDNLIGGCNTSITNFYNERRDGNMLVRFFAIADTKDYNCAITFEALRDIFKGDPHDFLGTFRTNSEAIMRVVDYKIKNGFFEEGETIMIRKKDFLT
jgi:hypothetical protein